MGSTYSDFPLSDIQIVLVTTMPRVINYCLKLTHLSDTGLFMLSGLRNGTSLLENANIACFIMLKHA